MKIVLVQECFSKDMGYIFNMLPKYLARLGLEVHMITTKLPYYYYLKDFNQTYGDFLSNKSSQQDIEEYDGYTLHTLPHKKVLGYVQPVGLIDKLKMLKPDIVQTFAAIGWIPLYCALAQSRLKYKLFTGNHNAASVFKLGQRTQRQWDLEELQCFITRSIPGRIVSLFTEKCYTPTIDCGTNAWRFYGVEKQKVEVMHLGVDTDIFYPPISDSSSLKERENIRTQLGFSNDDIICVYTGRMTEVKNPLILAKAIEVLRTQGKKFSGLFIGQGIQQEEIRNTSFCKVLDFMPFSHLGPYYRAADISVWPVNESTSMLDAAACGLPLIMSDGVIYRDHIDGNGLIYHMNDLDDLVTQIFKLEDPKYRKQLSEFGVRKMFEKFTWDYVAKRRLNHYEESLSFV